MTQKTYINLSGRIINMHSMTFLPGAVVRSSRPPGPPWSAYDPKTHGMQRGFIDLDARAAEYHGDAARHPEG